MDLDDLTMEQVAAARSALREAIRDVEMPGKKGNKPWLWYLSAGWSWEALSKLRAMDARVSILMTRLEDEAEEVA